MKRTSGRTLFVCMNRLEKGWLCSVELKHNAPLQQTAGCSCMDTAFSYGFIKTQPWDDCCYNLHRERSWLLNFAVGKVMRIPGSLFGIFKFYVNLFVEAGLV